MHWRRPIHFYCYQQQWQYIYIYMYIYIHIYMSSTRRFTVKCGVFSENWCNGDKFPLTSAIFTCDFPSKTLWMCFPAFKGSWSWRRSWLECCGEFGGRTFSSRALINTTNGPAVGSPSRRYAQVDPLSQKTKQNRWRLLGFRPFFSFSLVRHHL